MSERLSALSKLSAQTGADDPLARHQPSALSANSGYKIAALFLFRTVPEVVVRFFNTRPARVVRALLVGSFLAAAGCSGGSSSSGTGTVPFFGNGACDPGTPVQLAFPNDTQGNPTPQGVSTTIGHIEIVAQSNATTLGTSSTSWDTILIPTNGFSQIGPAITGGFLTVTSDPGGPHPFTTDFYWNSSIPTLQSGVLYVVQLNVPSSNCTPVTIGQFGT